MVGMNVGIREEQHELSRLRGDRLRRSEPRRTGMERIQGRSCLSLYEEVMGTHSNIFRFGFDLGAVPVYQSQSHRPRGLPRGLPSPMSEAPESIAVSDTDLVRRVLSGNREAFRHLVLRHEKRLFAIAYHMTGNAADANDLIQEVFLKAYHSLKQFRGEASLGTWLRRVTINHCLNHLESKHQKAAKRKVALEDAREEGDIPAAKENNPEGQAYRREVLDEVARALATLSEEHRAVIVLKDVEGYDYPEMAAILDTAEGTVKSRLSRARAALRKILQERGVTFP